MYNFGIYQYFCVYSSGMVIAAFVIPVTVGWFLPLGFHETLGGTRQKLSVHL